MTITIDLPEELSAALAASGQELPRAAMEAIALQAYREQKLSAVQLRNLLGFSSGYDLEAFLKQHRISLKDAGLLSEEGPPAKDPPLVQENGLLVHLGKLPQGFDWDRIFDEEREERIREVSGL